MVQQALKDLARTLEYKRKIETQHGECDNYEMAQVVVRAFDEGDAHIHEVLDKESKENKVPFMLWEVGTTP